MTETMDRKISRPRWRSRRVLTALAALGVVVILGLAAAALSFGARSAVRVPADNLTIETVRTGVFHDFVTLRATVVPRDIVFLDALEGGQVEEVMVQPGAVVAAGQPLIRFRNTELELEVLDREGRLVESITQLQAYEKQLEDARVANEKAAARIHYYIVCQQS